MKFGAPDDHDQAYNDLVLLSKIGSQTRPLKTKVLRGNSAPFMTRKLNKGIYTRTRLQKRYKKNPTKENELKFKRKKK